LKCCNKALEIDPNDAHILHNKALVLKDIGMYNEALECYDKALKIDPEYELALKGKEKVLKKISGGMVNFLLSC